MPALAKLSKTGEQSPSDIKKRLLDAHRTVSAAYNATQESLEKYSQDYVAWKSRATRVSRMIKLTKSADAIEDLNILLTQAKDYRDHFGDLKTQERRFSSSLLGQFNALKDAVQRFETMERRMALKKDLARLAGNKGVDSSSAGVSIDLREIDNIIHTAVALIELKEQKAVEA
jgi:hypothetical protein